MAWLYTKYKRPKGGRFSSYGESAFRNGTAYRYHYTPAEIALVGTIKQQGYINQQDFSISPFLLAKNIAEPNRTKPIKGKIVSDIKSLLKDFGIGYTKEVETYLSEAKTEVALENRVKTLINKALM